MRLDLLTVAALTVNQDWAALGNETLPAAGARFVRNLEAPDIRDANYVDNVTVSSTREIEALLGQADGAFRHCRHRRFDLDVRTPPEFEARLCLEGFTASETVVMLLKGDFPGQVKRYEIRLVDDAQSWSALEVLKALDHQVHPPALRRHFFERSQAKSPPVRHWLGYIDGVPRGFLSSWEGTERVGQVEDLFVHPDYRHRGLATALLQHCVADCRAHGTGPVTIVALVNDTPKQMYAALGWRPVAIKREYAKPVP